MVGVEQGLIGVAGVLTATVGMVQQRRCDLHAILGYRINDRWSSPKSDTVGELGGSIIREQRRNTGSHWIHV